MCTCPYVLGIVSQGKKKLRILEQTDSYTLPSVLGDPPNGSSRIPDTTQPASPGDQSSWAGLAAARARTGP